MMSRAGNGNMFKKAKRSDFGKRWFVLLYGLSFWVQKPPRSFFSALAPWNRFDPHRR